VILTTHQYEVDKVRTYIVYKPGVNTSSRKHRHRPRHTYTHTLRYSQRFTIWGECSTTCVSVSICSTYIVYAPRVHTSSTKQSYKRAYSTSMCTWFEVYGDEMHYIGTSQVDVHLKSAYISFVRTKGHIPRHYSRSRRAKRVQTVMCVYEERIFEPDVSAIVPYIALLQVDMTHKREYSTKRQAERDLRTCNLYTWDSFIHVTPSYMWLTHIRDSVIYVTPLHVWHDSRHDSRRTYLTKWRIPNVHVIPSKEPYKRDDILQKRPTILYMSLHYMCDMTLDMTLGGHTSRNGVFQMYM